MRSTYQLLVHHNACNGSFLTTSASCAIMLGDAAIEFKVIVGCLHAKSINDHRWYRVQGITRTLDSMKAQRKRGHHNMINMDLFARVMKDLHSNPESTLEWVVEYVKRLNVSEAKAQEIRKRMFRIFMCNKAPSLEACKRLWNQMRMSTSIGVAVDTECKNVFNGKMTKSEAGPVSQLILTQLEALCLNPICAGLKVAGIPTPDRRSGAKRRYTYHNRCTSGCKGIQTNWGFYTEVDLVRTTQSQTK